MKDFNMDAWLESVKDKEIKINSPSSLGYFKEIRVSTMKDTTYCMNCDCFSLLVNNNCPICGRTPGALERGTDKEYSEDYKIVKEDNEIIYKERDSA